MSFVHDYLRAIGFSSIKNKDQMSGLVQDVIDHYVEKNKVVSEDDGEIMMEISKSFSEDMGVMLRGTYDSKTGFSYEYFFPYFRGTGTTSEEEITVEKHAEKASYAGICEDIKVGVSLVFYIQNVVQYLQQEENKEGMKKKIDSVTLSGLSLEGKVLLPIIKDVVQQEDVAERAHNRKLLISAARQGDEEALESLTMEDIDTYTTACQRILTEDLFSIVDSYFMPYGIECDQYAIMGEILDVQEVKNSISNEEIYIINIDVNELEFDICINKKDLLGEPAPGRRFKGNIWLQGYLNF